MNSSGWSFQFVDGLLLVVGLVTILWGLQLWRKSTSLRANSLTYRWIYLSWLAWQRGRPKAFPKLTDKQIKHYAVKVVVMGIIVIIVAIMAIMM